MKTKKDNKADYEAKLAKWESSWKATKHEPEIITREDYMTIKVKPDFEPDKSFETIREAIDYCNEQPDPMYALGAIVGANCEMGEFGFAGDLVHEGDQIRRKPSSTLTHDPSGKQVADTFMDSIYDDDSD